MNKQREWLQLSIYIVIAAVVLAAGVFVSTKKKENTPVTEPTETAPSTTETTTTTTNTAVQLEQAQYVDLFSSIQMYVEGVYPDITDIHISGKENDALIENVEYSISNLSDPTPQGAEIMLEADTAAISDFLIANNYIPMSNTGTFILNPLKMESYLVQQRQLTAASQAYLIEQAAAAVTGSADSVPVQSFLILPASDTVFDAVGSYAGMYGMYSFFQTEKGIRGAFLSPVIKADGTIKSHDITLTEYYADSAIAYTETIAARLESNAKLMSVLLQGGANID